MKEYKKYKDTGVEWIGDIPFDWNYVRLKLISNISKGRKPKKDFEEFAEGLLPYMSMEYLRNKTNSPIYADSNESNLVLVEEGDLLILWDGSKAGEIVQAKKGVLSSTMAKIEIKDIRFESNYLNYLLQLGEKHIQNNTIGMGIPHVNGNILKNLMMLIPCPEEQTQIAKYLDYKTGLIDAVIEKKELLIKKLKEQRQAIINEAITKGLNPNAIMKDSGVEWLGKIPEQWNCMKMKNGCEFILDGTHGSYKRVEDGFRLLSVRNIIQDKFTFRDDDSCISKKDYLEISSKFKINKGDIQLAIVGATLGKAALVSKMSEDFVTQRSLATIRSNPNKLFNKYLYYFIKSESFQSYLWLNAAFSAQPGVYLGTLQNCTLPSIDVKEQIQIVQFIDEKICSIEKIYEKIPFQIGKLKSYRQSIISEAVTGKIDVRDWQAPKIT
jgi:type I restriction enzyme S subunit